LLFVDNSAGVGTTLLLGPGLRIPRKLLAVGTVVANSPLPLARTYNKENIMRLLHVVSVMLAVGAVTQAHAEAIAPDQSPARLESRYVKACTKDGDTEAYCRCDFAATSQRIKDAKQIEYIVSLTEQMAGLPEQEQQALLAKQPPDQLAWLISTAKEMEEIVKKCPDYKER
jgi:hypothetical protein